jgi:phytoene dehydrogenase-like protein
MELLSRTDVAVIGGGLAGLTTAAYLGRAGRSVVVLEKAGQLGGRAITMEQSGFLFNRGIHAFYQTGPGEAVLHELNVPYSAASSGRSMYEAHYQDSIEPLPLNAETIRTSRLLNDQARAELTRLLIALKQSDTTRWQGISIQDWLEQSTTQPIVRRFFEAAVRLAMYTNAPELIDAGFALHLIATQPPALRINAGWQTLVNGLAQVARTAGAHLQTGTRVTAVEVGEQTHRVYLANGETLEATAVVLATEPAIAARLVAHGQHAHLRKLVEQTIPVYAACLDIGVRPLPDPQRSVVLHFERPLFYSIHSRDSDLAPTGGALIHVVKYLSPNEKSAAQADRHEMEEWLDHLQPGWRDVVVAQQYLPHMQVSSDMLQARRRGLAGRPEPALPDVRNLYIVGDWVGREDYLANASFASARQASQLILANVPAHE